MKKKIKISSIILISFTVLFLALITSAVFTAVSAAKSFFEENGMVPENRIHKSDTGTITELDNFSVISVSGKGELTIEQSDKNSFQYFSNNQALPTVKNDTLFFENTRRDNYINVSDLKTIVVKHNINLDLIDIKTDTLNIKANNNAQITIQDLTVQNLNILLNNNSKTELYDIKKQNVNAKFVLKDNSTLYIDNSKNLNIDIQKDANAKIEIGN